MRRLLLQPSIERLEACEHAAHSKNRVAAVERPAAVRGTAAGLDADPLKSFVRDRDIQTGRLRNHGGIGSPPLDELVGADARMFFVDNCGHNQLAPIESSSLDDEATGSNHGDEAAFHVLRPASIQAAIPNV